MALNWIVAGASLIPNGLKHDGGVLRLSQILPANNTTSRPVDS